MTMTVLYQGVVKDGRVCLDDDPLLPEGARVMVSVVEEESALVDSQPEADVMSFIKTLFIVLAGLKIARKPSS